MTTNPTICYYYFFLQTGNMGTNTGSDITPPAVVTMTEEMGPPLESVKKKEMISYQTPDGSINNKLPPINGNCNTERVEV